MTEPADSPLALTAARHGHFRLESGHHADLWLDLETLWLHPARLDTWVAQLSQDLAGYAPTAVCGPLTSGAFLAQAVAARLRLPFFYSVRQEEADAGEMYSRQYRLPDALRGAASGHAMAVVDDAISAGSSVRATLIDLRQCGARPVVIGALLTLGRVGLDFLTAQGLSVKALQQMPLSLWPPSDCPLCAAGQPLQDP